MDHNNKNKRYAHQIPLPPPLSFPPTRFSSDNHNFYHNHHQFPQPPPQPPPPPPYHHPPRFTYHPVGDEPITRRQFYDRQPSPRVPYVVSDHHIPTFFDPHHQHHQQQFPSTQDLTHFYPEVVMLEEGAGPRDDWVKPPPPPPPRLPPIPWDYDPPNYNHHHHRDRPLNNSISPHHHHHHLHHDHRNLREEEEGSSNSYFSDRNRFSQQDPQVEDRIFPEYHHHHHSSTRGDGGFNGYQNQDFLWTQPDRRPNDNCMGRYGLANDEKPTKSWTNGGEDDNEDWRRRFNSNNNNHNEQRTTTTFDIEVNDAGHRVFTRKQRFSRHQPKNGKFKSMNDGADSSQEFFRTSTKKPQRTSALLRVQSATPRKWKGGEASLSSEQCFNEESSCPSRSSRGPLMFSDDKASGEDREAIPVEELDISFKSNSLVAKANSVPLNSDGTSTSKSKKRNITYHPVSGSLVSPVTEIHEGLVKGDSHTIHSVDLALRTIECLTESKDRVGDAESGLIDNFDLQIGTNGITVSLDHNGVVKCPLSSIVCSDGMHKPEIKNKKKKFDAPNSVLSSLRVTEVHEGPVNRDKPTAGVNAAGSSKVGFTQSEEKVKVAGNWTAEDVGDVSLTKMNILESPMVGSDAMCTAKAKRTRSIVIPLPGLSSSRTSEIHDKTKNANSLSSKGLAQSEERVAASGVQTMDNIGALPLHWSSASIKNNGGVGSSRSCLVVSDDSHKTKKRKKLVGLLSGSPRSRVTESHDKRIHALSSNHGADAASSSEKSLTHSKKEKVIASGIENSGEVGSPLSSPFGLDDSPKNKKRRLVDPLSGLSRSRVTESRDEPVNAVSSSHGADGASTVDKSLTRSEEKVLASVIRNVGSHPLVISSCENHAVERSHSSLALGYDAAHKPIVKKMKNKRSYNLGFPSSVVKIVRGPENADTCHCGAGATSNSYKGPLQPENKNIISDIVSVSDVGSQSSRRSSESLEDRGVELPVVTEADVRNFTHPNMDADMLIESSVLNVHSLPSEPESGQQDVIPVVNVSNCQQCPTQKENLELQGGGKREGQIEVDAEENGLFSRVTCEDIPLHLQLQENVGTSPLEVQSSDLDENVPSKAFEDDSYDLLVKAESMPNNMSPGAQCSSLSVNSNERIDCISDRQTKANSHEFLSTVAELHILNSQQSYCSMSGEKDCKTNSIMGEKLKAIDGVFLTGNDPSASESDLKMTSDEALQDDHLVPEMTLLLASEDTKRPAQILNLTGGELTVRKTRSSSPIPKALHTRTTLASGSLNQPSPSTNVARYRTWHRTDNISSLPCAKSCLITGPSQRLSQKRSEKIQNTSYIRKGNSLLRKCSPVSGLSKESNGLSTSVYLLNPVGRDETKKGAGSEKNVNNIRPPNNLKTSFERAKTPSMPHHMKSSNCTTKSSPDFTSSTSTGRVLEGVSEATSNPSKISERDSAPKLAGSSESEAALNRTLGTQSIINNENSIVYVKHKSNKLVAARHPSPGPSAKVLEKNQAVPCSISHDQYYKRKKNQLIRNAPLIQSHFKPAVTTPDESSHSEGQRTKGSFLKCSRNLSKQSPDKILFPWKRMTYWKKIITSDSSRSCSSMISRKLLLSRKRDTVYTRSTGGFSLRRSKVLSIGGSNLKWSKSIEKSSKKANEEATLAVAAVEKKKRDQKGAAFAIARSKSRHQSSRGRIFRIGSVRYKMDSSRRTLQRIPDEKSSSSLGQQLGKKTKVSFIPKRLLIGNNEYVRVGNGNQLVRDPKTRIRTLASEKVRWSLHTARLRLARKQQYCQFFTRFGKCKKESGKCPYIHDPAKIAVCTKYLNGLCSNTNCMLTHKVIPERMQDCSYFLQGLCTNKNCPYRHVNVNSGASVCEGFLKGYCGDGNECHKKHSYVCPEFESSGVCPRGTKCKLHHPRSLNTKKRKRKRSKYDNTRKTRGRYFGINNFDGETETRTIASGNKDTEQKRNESNFCQEGISADYISLDLTDSDTEEEEALETANNETTMEDPNTILCCNSYPSDLLESGDGDGDDDDDDDELLIKPFAIMNMKKKTSNVTKLSSSSYLADHRQVEVS